MKLLSIMTARSIWLGPTVDLNPRGLNLHPIVIPMLQETYKFIKLPSPQEILNPKDGLKFEKGEFSIDIGLPISIDFTIFDDGFVVDCRSSTDHADAFLEDVLTKFDDTFKISNYGQVISRRVYLSELFVTTDKTLELINPKFKEIAKYLSSNVEEEKTFEVGGINFTPDQTRSKGNPPAFRFERALNVPFSEKRYYSIAPLPTGKHIELLDKLEVLLAG
jgi:hypothetical protein